MSIVKHMENNNTNNNGNGLTIRGRVVKTGQPKMYQYGPKFYMQIRKDDGETVKCMVAIGDLNNPVREVPFRGDMVEFTTQQVNDNGWASVTLKRSFKILSNDGELVQNKIICENKVQTITNLLGELLTERYINEKVYNHVCDLLSRKGCSEEVNFSDDFSSHHHSLSTTSPPTETVEKTVETKDDSFTLPCQKCDGTGKINGKTCSLCKGTGGVSL